jgi:hypothetical protein
VRAGLRSASTVSQRFPRAPFTSARWLHREEREAAAAALRPLAAFLANGAQGADLLDADAEAAAAAEAAAEAEAEAVTLELGLTLALHLEGGAAAVALDSASARRVSAVPVGPLDVGLSAVAVAAALVSAVGADLLLAAGTAPTEAEGATVAAAAEARAVLSATRETNAIAVAAVADVAASHAPALLVTPRGTSGTTTDQSGTSEDHTRGACTTRVTTETDRAAIDTVRATCERPFMFINCHALK